MAITVRDHWPIIIFDMNAPTDAEHAQYLSELESRLWRGKPFAVVFNTLGSTGTSSSYARKLQIEFTKRHYKQMQAYLKGFAMVIDNPGVRALVTAVLWTQPLPMPHAIFKTEREAIAWSVRQLRDAGVSAPPPGSFI